MASNIMNCRWSVSLLERSSWVRMRAWCSCGEEATEASRLRARARVASECCTARPSPPPSPQSTGAMEDAALRLARCARALPIWRVPLPCPHDRSDYAAEEVDSRHPGFPQAWRSVSRHQPAAVRCLRPRAIDRVARESISGEERRSCRWRGESRLHLRDGRRVLLERGLLARAQAGQAPVEKDLDELRPGI